MKSLHSKSLLSGLVAGLLLVPVLVNAAPVTLTVATSSETLMEDFNSLPGGSSASYNGNGLTAAESFVGLTVNDPGGNGFEFFTGAPTNPLTLDVGAAGDGIYNIQGFAGLAGGTGGSDIGEGVVAVLFDYDILELGLTVNGSNGGAATFFFYGSNGALIDTIMTSAGGDLTFTSTQAFRGIAVQNTDFEGIAYDDFRFSRAAVPESGSTLALLGLALASLGFLRRKR